ncbi:MAG: hypothetical protein HOP07_04050 [Bacteriovoracaceae bacterium]|nr:hypothetical protein [Bacteriovoracaceae bacterium]
MKSFIMFLALTLSFSTFANTTVTAEENNSELQILDLVVGVTQTYSKTSELNAKVVEILGGDGMNPTRMVLVLSTGYEDTKIFNLDPMFYSVTRIVFLAKDVVVINYLQDSFDNDVDMNTIQVKKSITIQVLRNADGTLANEVKILK